MRMIWVLCLSLVWMSSAHALELEGDFKQGAMIRGVAEPGTQVWLGEQALKLTDQGQFIFAIGRDEKGPLTLRWTLSNGTEQSKSLSVEPRSWRISRIDGLPSRKVTPNPEDVARIKKDNQAIAAVRRLNTDGADFLGNFAWPVDGRVSSEFGAQRVLNGQPRRYHNGLDIAAPTGTLINAPNGGTVSLVHQDMFLAGKTVMIDHGHGLTSIYIHMSEILVAEGQRVETGTPIGKVGNTGRSSGPHLHWGVSWFGTHVDPELLVPARPKQ